MGKVKVELIRDGLEAAELSLSNEVADFEMFENHGKVAPLLSIPP